MGSYLNSIMDSYKITQYKKYSHIVILTDESFNYILKIPQEEKDLKNLLNEYELYQLIDHPAFDSYNTYIEYNNINIDSEIVINKSDKIYNLKLRNLIDINNYDLLDNKFSVLIGDYDTNMITFFEIKNNHISMDLLCQIYIKIFSIIKFCNDTYNFVHCDFKSNNILVDKNDPSNKVKIIDLEFSFIINENTRIKDLKNKNVNLYLQLKKNVILTPKFLKFLDNKYRKFNEINNKSL
jgi:serine/threonine protein kinase